ncbi:hypothetical protein GCM10007901_04410 [Dyella acidisoli]|uniref:Uncharacterized protein n=1 Tax=Dyella acidisoli TaxID=1867834 RepID=A0ABQ5XLP4_9GAMM|nr:hypothetical protein GCM10007901_04410 [Dyella acidisoli]
MEGTIALLCATRNDTIGAHDGVSESMTLSSFLQIYYASLEQIKSVGYVIFRDGLATIL